MTTTSTRRAVLAGAAALPALAASAAPASVQSPDADLIALGRQFEAAWADQLPIEARYNSAPEDDAAVEAEYDAVNDRVAGIVQKIEATPACTLDGLAVKARAISWCWGGRQVSFGSGQATDCKLAQSIVEDLLKVSIAVRS